MANALQNVAWEECLIEPRAERELEAYARRRMGIPYPAIRYFTPVPWLARALVDLHPEFGLLMHLDQRAADLVALVVSQENSCRFCYAAVRTLLWGQGMREDRIRRVEQDLASADLAPRTRAALVFGRSQSRSGPAAAREARAALRDAGVGRDEMKEIAYAVAITDFHNRVYTIPAIPVLALERMPEQLHVRLLRPLISRIVQSHRFRGKPIALEQEPSYPYARLVKAYEGSPIAPTLARVLEKMWSSPILSRRCKLLMLAVVARGLGCDPCAREVADALQQEGLDGAALARILTHLDGPELDDEERLLVHFARETIWYEPAMLQRRARALRERLPGQQFLEAAGVVALANGLCRLGAMVLEEC